MKSVCAPEAKLDDGLLDFTAIMHSPGFSPHELANELKEPMSPNNRSVVYRQLAEFVIESDQELHCSLDGEPVRKRKLKFSVRPGHLHVAY